MSYPQRLLDAAERARMVQQTEKIAMYAAHTVACFCDKRFAPQYAMADELIDSLNLLRRALDTAGFLKPYQRSKNRLSID